MRPAHSNIIFPGPGIGGCCLPKDGGLGVWAYRHIHGFEENIFKITSLAIDINDTHSLHVAQLTRDALRSLKRFFRSQDKLSDLHVHQDLNKALNGTNAVIFAVRHHHYLDLDPDHVVEKAGGPLAIIDCFGILDDAKIKRYFELGCEVKGLGRGHVKRIKDQVRSEREEMLMALGAGSGPDSDVKKA